MSHVGVQTRSQRPQKTSSALETSWKFLFLIIMVLFRVITHSNAKGRWKAITNRSGVVDYEGPSDSTNHSPIKGRERRNTEKKDKGAIISMEYQLKYPPPVNPIPTPEPGFIDNLLNDDPIPEYERLTFDMEPDVPVINNVDELNKDECFDPGGGEINVEVDDSFTFVIRTFLLYLTYPEVSPLLSSTENEDTIFDPGIST
ncbi:hypothetical protein Tco_1158687 [Tanacetum coccineum]